MDVLFDRVSHLKNRWNNDSAVQNSGEGQELPPEVGEALRALLEAAAREKTQNPSAPVGARSTPAVLSIPLPPPVSAADRDREQRVEKEKQRDRDEQHRDTKERDRDDKDTQQAQDKDREGGRGEDRDDREREGGKRIKRY